MKIVDGCFTFSDDDDLFMEILSFYLSEENIDDVMHRTTEYKQNILRIRKEQGTHEQG